MEEASVEEAGIITRKIGGKNNRKYFNIEFLSSLWNNLESISKIWGPDCMEGYRKHISVVYQN